MDKKTIGEEQRWVELHDCNDLFMKKICHLFDQDESYSKADAQP